MSAKKTLFMETTEIDPLKTAGEIIGELVKAGARQINQTYQNGKIAGIRWTMLVGSAEVLFDMPVRIDPVYNLFVNRRDDKGRWLSEQEKAKIRLKAERVAWRQLLRWTQAQLAMIDTGMVEAGEVFLPYMFNQAKSQTLFESMMESHFKLLPAGDPGVKQ